MKNALPFYDDLINLAGRFKRPEGELEERVAVEQHTLIMRQCLNMGVVNILNAMLVAIVFASQTPLWRIAIWYIPIFTYGIGQIVVWMRFRDSAPPKRVTGRFLRRAEISGLVMGLFWGSAMFVLPSKPDGWEIIFLMLIQGGMAAGVASLLTSVPRLVARFALGSLSLTVIGVLARGGDYAGPLIALCLVYLVTITVGNIISYRQLVSSVAANIMAETMRNDLTDAINSTPDAFAILDAGGKLVIANSRHRAWFGDDVPVPDATASEEPVLLPNGHWVMAGSRKTANGGTVCVHTDVTALKRRERELIEARREAEFADETKTRFLNTMSHELRTPLNVILGFARLMSPDSRIALKPEEVAEYARTIHTSADHLLCLINDIIEFSQMGLDSYTIERDDIPVRRLIERATAISKQMIEGGKDVDISIDMSEAMSGLRVDEGAARRILQNLISNAIKFRGNDPRIVIRAALTAEGRPFITVRDFGIGMSEDQMERAFDAFWQASDTLSREFNGTGLGLTLSRHLARLHGGDIILKSRPNAGTSATFILPANAHVKLDEYVPAEQPPTTQQSSDAA